MFIINHLFSVYTLYFFYGLAFLFLGASIALKDLKASKLQISSSLWLLSLFGFTHGAHEWIELFLLSTSRQFSHDEIYTIKILALIVVGGSFLFLLLFGLSLIASINKNKYIKWIKLCAIVLFIFIFLYFFKFESEYHDLEFFNFANNLLRKTFGFTGSLLAGYGLVIYSRRVKKISLPISRYFLYSGLGFYFYSIFAGLFQSHVQIPIFSIPVEFFRGVCAVLITAFLFKALNIFDIHTRKKLEQQVKNQARSEKMVSLGLLSAGVAHEINSPLTNASLNMQMLRSQFGSSFSDEKIKRKFDAIERNIERASIIAKELLQFSQTQETILCSMDVNQVLESALAQLEDRLISLKVSCKQDHLSKVELNAPKLEQVFLNVINNAIEATENSGELIIRTKQINNEIKIAISDDGTGISQEHLSKVFDPFFTTKETNKGTGLGLSICHGIIEQHGGTIALGNNKRGGCDVIITLPAL
jgi:signal transduction histidine kinase